MLNSSPLPLEKKDEVTASWATPGPSQDLQPIFPWLPRVIPAPPPTQSILSEPPTIIVLAKEILVALRLMAPGSAFTCTSNPSIPGAGIFETFTSTTTGALANPVGMLAGAMNTVMGGVAACARGI
jgi:hypothetical protein